MPKCHVCGAETNLYSSGKPICPSCDDGLAQKALDHKESQLRTIGEAQIKEILTNAMKTAQLKMQNAAEQFDGIVQSVPSRISMSDGSERIMLASRELSRARELYHRAFDRLHGFILNGEIPADLELERQEHGSDSGGGPEA